MNNAYYVVIFNSETEEVVKEMGPMPKWKALKVESGVNINLDHERFYTDVEERIDGED